MYVDTFWIPTTKTVIFWKTSTKYCVLVWILTEKHVFFGTPAQNSRYI